MPPQPIERARPPPGAVDEIRLVGDDQLRPFGQRRRVGRELGVDREQVVERIAPAGRIQIHHVQEQARALGVTQELMPEATSSLAPGMRPGRSAMTKVRSPSTRTMPRDGVSVVNG